MYEWITNERMNDQPSDHVCHSASARTLTLVTLQILPRRMGRPLVRVRKRSLDT